MESLRCGPQHEGSNPHHHRTMMDCGADGLALRRNRACRLKGAGTDDAEVSARLPPAGRHAEAELWENAFESLMSRPNLIETLGVR